MMERRERSGTMMVDLLSGKRTARAVAFVLSSVLAGPALALEPPTPGQLQRYRMDGTLAMRSAQARAYGNHLMPEHMQDRLIRKVKSLSSSLKGEAVAAVDPDHGAAPGPQGDADPRGPSGSWPCSSPSATIPG
jgi:hypothetical protein